MKFKIGKGIPTKGEFQASSSLFPLSIDFENISEKQARKKTIDDILKRTAKNIDMKDGEIDLTFSFRYKKFEGITKEEEH